MSKAAKVTPMMQQYWEVKHSLPPNTLLLFRLGDFYELFNADAEIGSKLLGITLTKRNDTPMAGIPFHAAETYLGKLLAVFGLDAEMLDPLAGVHAGRDCEIDPRIVEHPLGIILLHDAGLGAEQGGVEADRLVEVVDADMDVEALHADFLCSSWEGSEQAAPGAQSAPAQQFSMR